MPPRKRKGNPRETLQDEQVLIMDERIGNHLRHIREAHNFKYPNDFISQETLAHEVGISFNTYNRIENGKTSAQLPTLMKLAAFWKMSVQEMLANISSPTLEEAFNSRRIKRILEREG